MITVVFSVKRNVSMRFFISFVLAWSYVAAIPTSPYGTCNDCHISLSIRCCLGKYDVVGKQTNDGTSRFFVVGDWGGLPTSPFDTPSEVAVASAMGQMGLKLNTTFQLALGDNFYYDGVKAVNDSRFQVNDRDLLPHIEEPHRVRIHSNTFSLPQHFKRRGTF